MPAPPAPPRRRAITIVRRAHAARPSGSPRRPSGARSIPTPQPSTMSDGTWAPDARAARIRRTLASNVKRERDRKGLSQEGLGLASGLPRGTVSRVERAQQEPRLSTLDAFSAALGVPLEAFLAGLLGTNSEPGQRQQDH